MAKLDKELQALRSSKRPWFEEMLLKWIRDSQQWYGPICQKNQEAGILAFYRANWLARR
jgi:hypothetical protein